MYLPQLNYSHLMQDGYNLPLHFYLYSGALIFSLIKIKFDQLKSKSPIDISQKGTRKIANNK